MIPLLIILAYLLVGTSVISARMYLYPFDIEDDEAIMAALLWPGYLLVMLLLYVVRRVQAAGEARQYRRRHRSLEESRKRREAQED